VPQKHSRAERLHHGVIHAVEIPNYHKLPPALRRRPREPTTPETDLAVYATPPGSTAPTPWTTTP